MNRSTAWNPESYAKNARFVSDLAEPLLRILDPHSGELILDLGCGDGALTEKIAATSIAIGVDSSMAFMEACRARSMKVARMDGRQLAFKRRFDAVFSNAALHWMKQADRVVKGVADCLKPNGRFVGEFGGKGNVETIRATLHAGLRARSIDPWEIDPWYYPSVGEYSALLESFGFNVDYIELIPRPTRLPGDILEWLGLFAQPFVESVSQPERSRFLTEVRETLEPKLKKDNGTWYVDYVRLRFKARLQSIASQL